MRRSCDHTVNGMTTQPADHILNGWATTEAGAYAESAEPPAHGATGAPATLEFGRFSVLLRQRQLFADGIPIKLGTRAFDLLLALLEADGALVTRNELFSRAWPGTTVAEENLKVQIAALRKALGKDGSLIRAEFGRGYRFTGATGRTVAASATRQPARRRDRATRGSAPHWTIGWPAHPGVSRDYCGRRFA
jgi:DNA-binding winged helix-turn-helix (wHTH) protein